ncbi:MAG: hypothetical protein M1824_001857 [Vezdaea acicularis]|nr:MAG: hypothetical protein M1824_001857 [Vezdaea acicularis]
MGFLLYYWFQLLSLTVAVLGSIGTSIEKRTVPELLRTPVDGRINCDGPLPPFWVPLPKPDEGEQLTLHDLCAKAGGLSGPNVGGFCGDNFQIYFEPSFTPVSGRQIGNPRLFHYCKTRCVCEEQLAVASSRRTALMALARTEPLQWFPGDQTYMITLDENDDYKVPPSMHMGESGAYVPTTAVFQRFPAYLWRVSINPANSVTCSGPLPRDIPTPANIEDYTDLQQLCAIQHFGGNPFVFPALFPSLPSPQQRYHN